MDVLLMRAWGELQGSLWMAPYLGSWQIINENIDSAPADQIVD